MTGKPREDLRLHRLATPIGDALLVSDGEGALRVFEFADFEERMERPLRLHYGLRKPPPMTPAPAPLRDAIEAYFAGALDALDRIPCRTGGTPFQRAVWAALRKIPAGRTTSYGALAAKLGVPKAVRAVGLANGANPIGVVVPCHRVIGADGSLTGYGGGIERKRWLLRHEGALAVQSMESEKRQTAAA